MTYCEQTSPIEYAIQGMNLKMLKALQKRLYNEVLSKTELVEIERIMHAIYNPIPLKTKKK